MVSPLRPILAIACATVAIPPSAIGIGEAIRGEFSKFGKAEEPFSNSLRASSNPPKKVGSNIAGNNSSGTS